MKHDVYNKITKWSGHAITGLAFIITSGLALSGMLFLGLGLLVLVFFDRLSALMLFASGSFFLCLGISGLVWQLREQSARLYQCHKNSAETKQA